MRIAVLSDIHANRPALEAVLRDSQECEVEKFWCLGDCVGYGPHPVAALMFLKRYVEKEAWVIGNHDAMLAALLFPGDIRREKPPNVVHGITEKGKGVKIVARDQRLLTLDDWADTSSEPIEALEKNRAVIDKHKEADDFWRNEFTPERITPHEVHIEGIANCLMHASQEDHLFRYVYAQHYEVYLPAEFAALKKRFSRRKYPFVQWYGHSHVPTMVCAVVQKGNKIQLDPVRIFPGSTYPLGEEMTLVNPGSVGQPRDLDCRAAYAILDTKIKAVIFRRVAYDWHETYDDMLALDFNESLLDRLQNASADEKNIHAEWLDHFREAAKR